MISRETKKYVTIARIGKPHGLGGTVTVIPKTENKNWLEKGNKLFLAPPLPIIQFLTIDEVFYKGRHLVISFQEVDNRNIAEKLRGRFLQARKENLKVLDEDEFYYYEIESADVYLDNGEKLGKVKEIISTGANEVICVKLKEGKEINIPMLKRFIKKINKKDSKIFLKTEQYKKEFS